jgi:hypothetical protein
MDRPVIAERKVEREVRMAEARGPGFRFIGVGERAAVAWFGPRNAQPSPTGPVAGQRE